MSDKSVDSGNEMVNVQVTIVSLHYIVVIKLKLFRTSSIVDDRFDMKCLYFVQIIVFLKLVTNRFIGATKRLYLESKIHVGGRLMATD